jgi:hypothetical protein
LTIERKKTREDHPRPGNRLGFFVDWMIPNPVTSALAFFRPKVGTGWAQNADYNTQKKQTPQTIEVCGVISRETGLEPVTF